jgi:hypothetical protein
MRATLSILIAARSESLELVDSVLRAFEVVLVNLDREIPFVRTLVTHLLSKPGFLRDLGETHDELLPRRFVSHAGIFALGPPGISATRFSCVASLR